MPTLDLKDAILTGHATEQMQARRISHEQVRAVLATPERVSPVREGRVVAQGMVGAYLLRVFVDVDRTPAEVVTVYRTTKIDKYRSKP
ncbi:MAG: DUF4258 domain-containing protein [Phycisphaeraceae bacterium]|nr:DUF4258 domain-containing protein [Phycisphaeraceae bacterium]